MDLEGEIKDAEVGCFSSVFQTLIKHLLSWVCFFFFLPELFKTRRSSYNKWHETPTDQVSF